jgi:hypothetical protein
LGEERAEKIAGTPWTESEVSAVVDSYFRMLATERAGVPYSKAENRRRLMATVHRSEGSIERKLQNISAVLDVLGAQWINGYKPLALVHRPGRGSLIAVGLQPRVRAETLVEQAASA